MGYTYQYALLIDFIDFIGLLWTVLFSASDDRRNPTKHTNITCAFFFYEKEQDFLSTI